MLVIWLLEARIQKSSNTNFLNVVKAEADREEYKFRILLDNDDFDYSISPPVIKVRVITTFGEFSLRPALRLSCDHSKVRPKRL